MTEKEKLYETMGELLYVVAKADGVIQPEEKEKLQKLLVGHKWANEVAWSFEYEEKHNSDIDDIYNKVISYCHSIGPAPEYTEFIGAMRILANAQGGVDSQEEKYITSFSRDLAERFERDLNNGEIQKLKT